MAAATPTIPSHAGAVGVDHRSAITFRKSRIEALAAGALGLVKRNATGTGVSEWANSARFATGTGFQDNMAQSAVEGHLASVSFDGVDFGVDDAFSVHEINLELALLSRWQLLPAIPGPGEIGVRCIVAWDEEAIFEGLFRLNMAGLFQMPNPAPNLPVPPGNVNLLATRFGGYDSAAVPLTEALREVLGHPITIGALEGVGTSLRFLLSTWVGQEAFSPQWFAGPLKMVVKYRNPPDPRQTAVQWRVGSAVPVAANLLYDSGKLDGETSNYHTIQPSTITPGTRYVDVQVWDENDVASGFPEPASFTTLTAGQASLLHDPGEMHLAATWYPGILIPAPRWRRNSEVPSGSMPNVWQCRLSRSEQPSPAFSIVGVEEDPIITGSNPNWSSDDPFPPSTFVEYNEMDRDYDGLSALNTDPGGLSAFIWDEEGTLPSSGGEPTLYMRPSDGRWMAGWRGAAVLVRIRYNVATRYLAEWGGYNWEGRILGWPAITRKVDDLLKGAVSAPTGDFVLSDHDGALRKMIAFGQFPDEGWLTDGRPIEFRLMQEGVSFDDAPVVSEGHTRWPSGNILSDGKATFNVLPLELSPDRAENGRDTYSDRVYPAMRDGDKNKPIPEVYGLHSGGYYPAAVVDKGPDHSGGGAVVLRGVRQSGALLDFRLADTPIDPTFYTFGGSHIYATAAGRAFFRDNIAGDFQVRHAGTGVGAGVFATVGAVARLFVAQLGIPFASMEATAFDAYSQPCFLLVQGPTKILTLLHRVQRSGLFRVVQRIDRRWAPVPETPAYLDDGLIIDDYEVIGKPGWTLRKELMGATLAISYPADTATPASERRKWDARSYRSAQQYGMQSVVDVELDTTDASIFHAYAERLDRPVKDVSIRTGRKALYAYPGRPVALSLNRALAPGGAEAWALCSVEEYRQVAREVVELDLRFSRTLPEEARS